jgi:hypothetical protein
MVSRPTLTLRLGSPPGQQMGLVAGKLLREVLLSQQCSISLSIMISLKLHIHLSVIKEMENKAEAIITQSQF